MDGEKDEQVSISRSRWLHGALAIAILNPIFSGLILGVLMWRSPGLEKEGRIVTLFSLAWGAVVILLLLKYGPVPSDWNSFSIFGG